MMSKTIRAEDTDRFRDLLPISGVFEMTDCTVEVYYPETATTEDLDYIKTLLESMIHITDIRVTQNPEEDLNDVGKFKVEIHEATKDDPKYRNRK